MAMELPAAQKVNTHVYDNFKGVDFTNDATNVWHRRSPDAVNMLPDDSGRPFKRTGWEVVVPVEKLADILGAETEILKCHYFELAGIDHILIFAKGGVFRYTGEVDQYGEVVVDLLSSAVFGLGSGDSTDPDCYSSYDRAFFFEGNGIAAFYIYGKYKVWVYGYDAENGKFTFKLAQEGFDVGNIKIPTLLITTDPSSCAGVMLESYNLLGNTACVEYQSNDMLRAYPTGNFTIEVDGATFKTGVSEQTNPNKTYTFTYASATDDWDMDIDGTPSVSGLSTADLGTTYGITLNGTPANGNTIVVLYIVGILLPNNVSLQQLSQLQVYGTTITQFDTPYEPIDTGTPQAGECLLVTDTNSLPAENRKAWLQFNSADLHTTDPDSQEDIFRVVFPTKKVDITNYPDDLADPTDAEKQGAASLNTGD